MELPSVAVYIETKPKIEDLSSTRLSVAAVQVDQAV